MGQSRVQCVVVKQWQAYLMAAKVVEIEQIKPKPVLHLYDPQAETTVCRRTHTGAKPVCCLVTECAEPCLLETLKQCQTCCDIAARERCARRRTPQQRESFGEAVAYFNGVAHNTTMIGDTAIAIRRFRPAP